MVDAMRVMEPSSMYSSRVCCCFLLRYWISSRYSTTPSMASKPPRSAMRALISPVEAVVPFRRYSFLPAPAAMMRAAVVLPTPEGP